MALHEVSASSWTQTKIGCLTVRFPFDSSYLYGRVSTLNAKHPLSIESVDVYLFVNRSQRNQIHSWAACQVFRVDGWLHLFFCEWISHLDGCVSEEECGMPPCKCMKAESTLPTEAWRSYFSMCNSRILEIYFRASDTVH